ncbi:MAG: helix-turn-helix transcriptional regulator [Micromonosporaceae bacterium]|nr:helix-turn-helix transcriptional regulator [Micromonosporaceae bacterium]
MTASPDSPLAPNDRRQVLEALRVIGAADSINDFAELVCRELLRLVPGVSASYNEVNLAAGRVAGFLHPDPGREWFLQYSGVLEAHLRDNPIVRYFEVTGENDIVTWSDLDPDGAFFESPLYREFYAPNGIHSQLGFLLPAPPGIHVGLVINRDGAEFTARERALVAELRQHLVNLYRLVLHAEAGRQRDVALADDGWSVVLVDDAGTVVESNDLAVTIGQTAGVDLTPGARLGDGPLGRVLSDVDWTRSGRDAPFEARLERSPIGPHVLWIRQPNRVTVADAMALGLTERQAEVAVLLVDGLTNERIAQRLGISTGTVRAHLDGVFRRLKVSSRAAVVGRLWGAAVRSASLDGPRPSSPDGSRSSSQDVHGG